MSAKPKILIIDNYDSFTYNLVQYIGEKYTNLHVVRNDKISLNEIKRRKFDLVIISPGPCTPREAGISVEVVKEFHEKTPILGVCLGHQSIGVAFGAKIVRAPEIMHGKTSKITHDKKYIYRGMNGPITVMRYHSLIIKKPAPKEFVVTSKTSKGIIMGIRHRKYPHLEGIQFHPESIMTPLGKKMLHAWVKRWS